MVPKQVVSAEDFHSTHRAKRSSDYAVLVVAIHSALQIFRPASRGTSDGLYGQRYYIFSGGFILPGLMAALAFVNPGPAYESLGAFCQLPIRPFWYRLAFTWVPRYFIAFIILALAGAIYAYVGCEFRSYANLSQSGMTPMTTTLGLSRIDGDLEMGNEQVKSETSSFVPKHLRRASSVAHDVVASSQRRGSAVAVAFATTTYGPTKSMTMPTQRSMTLSAPGSSTNLGLKPATSVRPGLFVIPSGYVVKTSPISVDPQGPLSPFTQAVEDPMSSIIVPDSPVEPPAPRQESLPPSPAQKHLSRQRRRIHRQLRLMFIYPLVYIIMNIIPFVQHTMNYNDYYASHPLWFTRIGQTICMASMGFVDCLIFTVREKPWRNIPTSDGTIWGSLAVWRSPRSSFAESISRSRNASATGSRSGSLSASNRNRSMTGSAVTNSRVQRVKNSVRTSASDDYTRMAADQARKRLDMEKVERLAEFHARRARGSESEESGASTGGKGKEKAVDSEDAFPETARRT
jgi:hypothetical protein